ncbi:L-serine ammonia-lyase [Marinicauda algicola]|uniref:L-serine dehydratase n=1 Tax=Marinicauda algicola TaxID=2029849 RepID=A0A4S2GY71_9PROT|nr:L-serine ammonia-lyase [Marinicauda algicola]TGY87888.1 L-serine ammonia-lyase [Marinicauda algicola]
MHFGVFDLFKIGVGPSSSHTVGPMKAARLFLERIEAEGRLGEVARVEVEAYGSLALTGPGHATDKAMLWGLEGVAPDEADPDAMPAMIARIESEKTLKLLGGREIAFDPKRDLRLKGETRLPFHSNAMKFKAFDPEGDPVREEIWYSIGGGFVIDEAEAGRNSAAEALKGEPYPFDSCNELLDICDREGLSIPEVMMANETAFRSEEDVRGQIASVFQAMEDCIERGTRIEGELPGGLRVKRRAPGMRKRLMADAARAESDPLAAMEWVNLWAMAVNEENAAGGKVVTAPTNGAAGIIPAVARYFDRHYRRTEDPDALVRFFLTAAAIGALYKKNASISGAEAGCQGEVGVACSMAAGGLAAALGGSNRQIENAAEIGMEHNLGLTCDPVGGLVQIPCIERNAIGAIKAINAARLAMVGSAEYKVRLDQVIATMHQTGLDMADKYKETSTGGLAVNVPMC